MIYLPRAETSITDKEWDLIWNMSKHNWSALEIAERLDYPIILVRDAIRWAYELERILKSTMRPSEYRRDLMKYLAFLDPERESQYRYIPDIKPDPMARLKPEVKEIVENRFDSSNPLIAMVKNSVVSRCKKYGISINEYLDALEKTGGKCPICEAEVGSDLVIDHDHGTGEFRGLLCSKCNLGLGCFNDNPNALGGAINYLIAHGASGIKDE